MEGGPRANPGGCGCRPRKREKEKEPLENTPLEVPTNRWDVNIKFISFISIRFQSMGSSHHGINERVGLQIWR